MLVRLLGLQERASHAPPARTLPHAQSMTVSPEARCWRAASLTMGVSLACRPTRSDMGAVHLLLIDCSRPSLFDRAQRQYHGSRRARYQRCSKAHTSRVRSAAAPAPFASHPDSSQRTRSAARCAVRRRHGVTAVLGRWLRSVTLGVTLGRATWSWQASCHTRSYTPSHLELDSGPTRTHTYRFLAPVGNASPRSCPPSSLTSPSCFAE